MEENKIVKSIEEKLGGRAGIYWKITWQDGKSDNIFDGEWLTLLEHSQKENRLLHITKEKNEKNPKYLNVVSLELATLPDKPPEAPQSKSSPVKVDSGSKASLTKDEQIEKAVWIKEIGECLRAGAIDKSTPLGKSLNNAYYTEMCRVLGVKIKEEA